MTEYALGVPFNLSGPLAITGGPDGNVWFTETGSNQIGISTPAGVISQKSLPTPNASPWGITAGPDGNCWFIESIGKLGRITPAGVITEFDIPDAQRKPGKHNGGGGRVPLVYRSGRRQDRSKHDRWGHHRVPSPLADRGPLEHRRRPRFQSLVHRVFDREHRSHRYVGDDYRVFRSGEPERNRLDLSYRECVDATAFSGLQLSISGSLSGCTFFQATQDSAHLSYERTPTMDTGELGTGAPGSHPNATLLTADQITPTPQTFEMPFAAQTDGVPANTPTDRSQLTYLNWAFVVDPSSAGGPTACIGDLTINDVRFY